MDHSISLDLAKQLLNKKVKVIIDRPLDSVHPKWGFKYECNYGYIDGVLAPDGEELDAYVLKINEPLKEFNGMVVAIVHRVKDDDDKVIVLSEGVEISNEDIEKSIEFQERWFEHKIIR